jgi:hypothetical protein
MELSWNPYAGYIEPHFFMHRIVTRITRAPMKKIRARDLWSDESHPGDFRPA